jgi:2,3-bisphosphoglycerate-dependent phosphoglycerate mutase
MKTIYLVRHAKAEGQPFEAPLTTLGQQQAKALVEFFHDRPIDKIYSSPYVRTKATIRPLAEVRGLPIHEDDRLAERKLGKPDIENWREKLQDTFNDFDLAFPEGESNRMALARAESMIQEVLASDDEHIVLVSHGNLTTLLLHNFDQQHGYDTLIRLTNPDVYEITVHDEGHTLRRIWDDRI